MAQSSSVPTFADRQRSAGMARGEPPPSVCGRQAVVAMPYADTRWPACGIVTCRSPAERRTSSANTVAARSSLADHYYVPSGSMEYSLMPGDRVLSVDGRALSNPRDLSAMVKELSKWKFSGFVGLNTLFVALCNNEAFRKLDFSALKVTLSGGMALQLAAAERWKAVTGCPICEGYGMTETSPVATVNPIQHIQPAPH